MFIWVTGVSCSGPFLVCVCVCFLKEHPPASGAMKRCPQNKSCSFPAASKKLATLLQTRVFLRKNPEATSGCFRFLPHIYGSRLACWISRTPGFFFFTPPPQKSGHLAGGPSLGFSGSRVPHGNPKKKPPRRRPRRRRTVPSLPSRPRGRLQLRPGLRLAGLGVWAHGSWTRPYPDEKGTSPHDPRWSWAQSPAFWGVV